MTKIGIEHTVPLTFRLVEAAENRDPYATGKVHRTKQTFERYEVGKVRAILEIIGIVIFASFSSVLMGFFFAATIYVFGWIIGGAVAAVIIGLALLIYKDPDIEDVQKFITGFFESATAIA